MIVRINIPQFLQHLVNGVEVADVEGSTVGQCLNNLVKRFPHIEKWIFDKDGKLLKHVDIYVNGKSTYPEELAKPVNEGDELYILLAMAGG